MAHTFAGTSLRSMLGFEGDRAVFARYRERRRLERKSYTIAGAEPERAHLRLSQGRVRA